MPLILNIDTSTEQASIALADQGECLCFLFNDNQKDHAAWLHPAIKDCLGKSGKTVRELDAIAVTGGPGSYTGLRVGMAAAKGLCYALSIPFISINTLYAMASGALPEAPDYICPMIDARRMEVFTALYDKNLSEIIAPQALILEGNSFSEFLDQHKISFFGNGARKFAQLAGHNNAIFNEITFNALILVSTSLRLYGASQFTDLVYTQPFYGKEYFSSSIK